MTATEAYLLFLMIHDRMREMRNVCNILVGEPEGHRILMIPEFRWKNNIKRVLSSV
jgi:hypothetical protein